MDPTFSIAGRHVDAYYLTHHSAWAWMPVDANGNPAGNERVVGSQEEMMAEVAEFFRDSADTATQSAFPAFRTNIGLRPDK